MTSKPVHDQKNKHLKDILLLFSVPIGIIFITISLIYIPRLFANPSYDFIYCSGYDCHSYYQVNSSDKVESVRNSTARYFNEAHDLRYYDVEADASRPITIDEAQKYRLDTTSKSPDGYALESHTHSGGPFSFSYQENWSLKKGILAKPASLSHGRYSSDINFIGWVISNE